MTGENGQSKASETVDQTENSDSPEQDENVLETTTDQAPTAGNIYAVLALVRDTKELTKLNKSQAKQIQALQEELKTRDANEVLFKSDILRRLQELEENQAFTSKFIIKHE